MVIFLQHPGRILKLRKGKVRDYGFKDFYGGNSDCYGLAAPAGSVGRCQRIGCCRTGQDGPIPHRCNIAYSRAYVYLVGTSALPAQCGQTPSGNTGRADRDTGWTPTADCCPSPGGIFTIIQPPAMRMKAASTSGNNKFNLYLFGTSPC